MRVEALTPVWLCMQACRTPCATGWDTSQPRRKVKHANYAAILQHTASWRCSVVWISSYSTCMRAPNMPAQTVQHHRMLPKPGCSAVLQMSSLSVPSAPPLPSKVCMQSLRMPSSDLQYKPPPLALRLCMHSCTMALHVTHLGCLVDPARVKLPINRTFLNAAGSGQGSVWNTQLAA